MLHTDEKLRMDLSESREVKGRPWLGCLDAVLQIHFMMELSCFKFRRKCAVLGGRGHLNETSCGCRALR